MGTAAENTQCFPSKPLLHKQMSRPLPTLPVQTAAGAGQAKLVNCWCHPGRWEHGLMLTLGWMWTAGGTKGGEGHWGTKEREQTSCSLPRGNGPHGCQPPLWNDPCTSSSIPAHSSMPETTKAEGTSPERRGQWWFARPKSCQNRQRRCQWMHPAGSWEEALTTRVFGHLDGAIRHSVAAGHQAPGHCCLPAPGRAHPAH